MFWEGLTLHLIGDVECGKCGKRACDAVSLKSGAQAEA